MSVTKEIARLREKHWLEVSAVLGRKTHEYGTRDLAIEAIQECADAHNYLRRAEGTSDLAEDAADLGDRIARRKGWEEAAR